MGAPQVKRTHHGIVLRRSFYEIGFGLSLFAFGLFLPVFVWLLGGNGGWFDGVLLAAVSVVALAMCVGGILMLLHCPRVSCEYRGAREIVISYGFHPVPKHVRVPAEGFKAELAAGEHVRICLIPPSGTQRVQLARGSRKALMPAFEALRDFLGGHTKDKTLVPVEIRSGRTINVPKSPLTHAGANFKNVDLSFPTPDTAVLRPTGILKFAAFGFLFFGLAALAIGVGVFFSGAALVVKIFVPGLGAIHTMVGIFLLFVMDRTRRIVYDRTHDRITFDRSTYDPFTGKIDVAVSDIAGIQICSRLVEPASFGSMHSHKAVQDYATYEMNVVLAEPEGKRIFIMSHAVEAAVRADAARLAAFLGTRVLDHTK